MRVFIIFALTAILLAFTGINGKVYASGALDIKEHHLSVVISPNTKSLRATDEVVLTGGAYRNFSFTLNKNLLIFRITCDGKSAAFDAGPYSGPDMGETGITDNFQTVTVDLPKGATSFIVNYGGEVYDPIEPSKALGRVRGDFTSGIISADGVYLASITGWYPDTEKAMAAFDLEVNVPKSWYAVSQGNLVERHVDGSRRISTWDSGDIPFDGCTLVANEYYVQTRTVNGIDFSTYFYGDNPDLSNSFLDMLEEYFVPYVELFGDYPYERFDIVENFFSTGYGMPGYTLLGSMVLRMPYATREGSLAHELVHNWWGNYVFPDWDTGNWCEGITYYSTNYYWNILKDDPEAAEDYRYTDMLKYTLQVSDEETYPVREFRTKMTAEDGDIGYGKSGAIFGMLHQMMGDEKFFDALKLVIRKHGGRLTTWDDFRDVFEVVYEHDLNRFFGTWLDNKDTPKLEIDSVKQMESGSGYHVEIELSQEGEQFEFTAPVLLKTENDEYEFTMNVYPNHSSWMDVFLDDKAVSIEIDPEFYIFRRLERAEIVPCLSATMEADSLLVIIPTGGENDMLQVRSMMGGPMGGMQDKSVKQLYEELAKSITEEDESVIVKYDNEVTDADLKSSSILCLGAPQYNSLTAKLAKDENSYLDFIDDGFNIDGVDYTAEGNSVLVNVRNPYNDAYDITFYFGNSPQGVFKASYIFFYTMYSYVIFEDGNAIDRGKWERGKGSLYRVLD